MKLVAAGCAAVVVAAVLAAIAMTAWALLVIPPALVVGIAAWRGVGPRTALGVLAQQDDPGTGPSGMLP